MNFLFNAMLEKRRMPSGYAYLTQYKHHIALGKSIYKADKEH